MRAWLWLLVAAVAAPACSAVELDATAWACTRDENCGQEGVICHPRSGFPEGICIAELPPARAYVPRDPFLMGCEDGVEGLSCLVENERPAHIVDPPPYVIDQVEVTVGRYLECMGEAGPCEAPPFLAIPECINVADLFNLAHPINCVNHAQAETFCDWAGGRLCSESEWEKAARGGCRLVDGCAQPSFIFPWGFALPSCDNAVHAEVDPAPESDCKETRTRAVGTRPAGWSPYGMADMAGNVAEWVADCYAPTYDDHPDDGSAWQGEGPCDMRIVRGGAYDMPASEMRVHARFPLAADIFGPQIGFRCCYDVEPIPEP